jgi:hypothetical protein
MCKACNKISNIFVTCKRARDGNEDPQKIEELKVVMEYKEAFMLRGIPAGVDADEWRTEFQVKCQSINLARVARDRLLAADAAANAEVCLTSSQ